MYDFNLFMHDLVLWVDIHIPISLKILLFARTKVEIIKYEDFSTYE